MTAPPLAPPRVGGLLQGLKGAGGDGGGGGGSASDIFSHIFGGGGGGGGGRGGPRKARDIMHPLDVSLEDLYKGRTVKLAISRDATCGACAGNGTSDGSPETHCADCRGRGMVTHVRQFGPGMIQQMTAPCGACRGTGKNVPDDKKCKACGGKKLVKERKTLEVHIEKGMKHGSKVVFRGEGGGAEAGVEPGDVVFVVQQKQHSLFKRDGNDLFFEKDLPLVDALTGAHFLVTHLDGRRLRISTIPREVIAPGQFKCVEGAGMPIPGTGGMRFGDMYVRFNVVFPPSGSIDARAATALKAYLPRVLPAATGGGAGTKGKGAGASAGSSSSSSSSGRRMEEDGDEAGSSSPAAISTLDDFKEVASATDAEDVTLTDVTAESRAARVREQHEAAGTAGEAYDSDEEHPRGAQRVQCAHQ